MKPWISQLEKDVVASISLNNGEMRRNRILEELYPKYQARYSWRAFDVTLNRVLKHLVKTKQLKRESRSYRNVLYVIPSAVQMAVEFEHAKNLFLQQLGTYVIEMQKRALENLTLQLKIHGIGGFVEDVYESLSKNAALSSSTETEEERERRKDILKETGGKVQVSIPEKETRIN